MQTDADSMRKRSRALRWLVRLGILAFLLQGCYFLLYLPLGVHDPPMTYTVEADFQELPPDDKELEQWLLQQPDVYIGFIQRDDSRIVVVWGNSRTCYWNSITPNLRAEFERFGYKRLVSYRESKAYRDK